MNLIANVIICPFIICNDLSNAEKKKTPGKNKCRLKCFWCVWNKNDILVLLIAVEVKIILTFSVTL